MTQQELAKRLKRPQSFVSAYESGQRRVEVLEFLQIADALEVEACELLQRIRQ
jgi:transcriptional regulator with XRE-family HTH domain